MERTFSFIKPDGVERKLVGKIIARFEDAGLKIVKLKMGRISKELAAQLYADTKEQLEGMGKKTFESMTKAGYQDKIKEIFGTEDPYLIGKQIREWNIEYATSGDVVAMVLEGENAVKRVREIIGKTDPALADKGTIRGDFANDSILNGNMQRRACRNIIHASDGDSAPREIELFEKNFF